MRKRLSAWIATPGNGIGFTISVVVLFGVAAGIIGLIRNIGFLRDIAPEFIGIGFTVLVLDALNRLRLSQQERIRVATQMASESNAFALEAVRLARHYGWLHDGSFRRIDLKGANLENADLASADLAGCSLVGANLFRANFGSWRMTETLKGKIVAWGESGDKPTNLHGSLLAG
ncbi:MAG: pentapeptide repeat-containing protein [Caldilineaceae bacterium]|nr:pentapeptide repeat-containing protein [Caldilineaceae bacterium]